MFCKHCGKEISNDSKFCQYCGKAPTEPIIQQSPMQNTEAQVTQKPKNSKKSKIFLGVIIGLVLIIIFSFIAKIGIDKHKEEEKIKKISSVQLSSFTVSREQYDVIDPNYILRYALNDKAKSGYLTSYGFSKDESYSDDKKTTYKQKNVSDSVEEIEVVLAKGQQNVLTVTYNFTPQYTNQSLLQITNTLQDITNTSLKWYNNGSFYDTASLELGNSYMKLGKEYVCVVDVKPRFIQLKINQDGRLKVSYAFSEDKYFKTYQDFTENAVPADYEAIQKNECDYQQVYISGTVAGVIETNIFDIALILADGKPYKAFFYKGDYVNQFSKNDTVKVYGAVLPDSALDIYDRHIDGFDIPFEAIQADVIERVES